MDTTPNATIQKVSDNRSIDSETKQKILDLIKDGSVKVSVAAKTYSVSPKTIYGWLTQESAPTQTNSTELMRIRRENKALLELVGQLTHEMKRSKKKNWRWGL